LSDLARALGLPGRDALEHHGGLTWETGQFPLDAGEDLARVQVFLPTGVALEVLQESERSKYSPSRLLADALGKLKEDKLLGVDDAPATDPNAKERSLVLYLPRTLLAAVESVGDARGESVSVIVRKAWSKAREAKEKARDEEKEVKK
jgi:hypothetical protein